jgi:protein subunit release factor A
MSRQRVIRVTIKDCTVQTFRSGGKGGQNQNKRDTGVRVIHPPSGARGESREERSQLQNKRAAFVRMAESPEFQTWIRLAHARAVGSIEAAVDDAMRPENLLIETEPFDEGVT